MTQYGGEAYPWVRLKYLAQVRSSNVDKLVHDDEIPVRLCNYLDVYYNDRITDAIDFSPGSATRQEIERFALLPGDVVITKDSELRDDIAVPALVEESGAGTVCGYHLAIIRPNSRRASGSFLFWALWSRPVAEQFANQAKGVTRFGLTLHGIGSVRVPVPHLQMQKRIAVFLDRETARIEELINRKQRMNSLLDDMEQALLETLVKGRHQRDVDLKASDAEWIGNIPRHWQVAKLTHVARLESGHTPNRSVDEYWIPEECTIPWFTLADVWQLRRGQVYVRETAEKVSPRGLANSAARLLPAGTVILSRTASVGFPGILAVPMATSQDFVNWVCGPQLRPKYLYYVLRSMRPEFSRLVMGSTHQTLYMPVVRAFRIPLPPIREQDEIVIRLEGQLDKLHRLRELNAKAIERLRELRAALITAAVTGNIDVETWRRRGETERRIDQVEDDLAEG